ncbi:MAG: DUF2783 domain-containing protein [Hoeflea sp.]|uniref:DUF2783 domain-containing protein n=1 Tax=Hoeflea sp. TaxID=1940281 RepID=UPI0027320750|nr:DUF2783 domain-containing protein [Hoeflea sp.]MDP2122409.1 DUF2783 domain-containing protein [Hoeflea sp.]MDP3524104.1 DUF2783 domain-containing protein [Hoeflea sp.]
MAKLLTSLNIAAPDEFYERLIRAHEGLSEEESASFNARLILILANHVGDAEVLAEALQTARKPAP